MGIQVTILQAFKELGFDDTNIEPGMAIVVQKQKEGNMIKYVVNQDLDIGYETLTVETAKKTILERLISLLGKNQKPKIIDQYKDTRINKRTAYPKLKEKIMNKASEMGIPGYNMHSISVSLSGDFFEISGYNEHGELKTSSIPHDINDYMKNTETEIK